MHTYFRGLPLQYGENSPILTSIPYPHQVRSAPSEALIICMPLAKLPTPSLADSQAVSPSSIRLSVAGAFWTPDGMYSNDTEEFTSTPTSGSGCVV